MAALLVFVNNVHLLETVNSVPVAKLLRLLLTPMAVADVPVFLVLLRFATLHVKGESTLNSEGYRMVVKSALVYHVQAQIVQLSALLGKFHNSRQQAMAALTAHAICVPVHHALQDNAVLLVQGLLLVAVPLVAVYQYVLHASHAQQGRHQEPMLIQPQDVLDVDVCVQQLAVCVL